MNMKLTKLLLLITPLVISLGGCAKKEEDTKYQVIDDPEGKIMQEYYRQHNENQSNLIQFKYSKNISYDPTYDVFGKIISDPPADTLTGLYFESTHDIEIDVYSGYLIKQATETTYSGNKENVGSINKREYGDSYWFRNFDDDLHNGYQELIHRVEEKDNDLDKKTEDHKSGTAVEVDNIANYFSNNINTETYSALFEGHQIKPREESETMRLFAYLKSEAEIIEEYSETLFPEDKRIVNPLLPGDDNVIAVEKQTKGKTIFQNLENIGWACTEFSETITYSISTDFELNVLEEPKVIYQSTISTSFSYSQSVQPYSGDAFIYHEVDPNYVNYLPKLYEFDGVDYIDTVYTANEISASYKQIHPEFAGYAYSFESVVFHKDHNYSFSCASDLPNKEGLGYRNLTNNANGTLIPANIGGHDLIKTLDKDAKYEFIILIATNGNRSIIGHLSK